MSEPAPSSRSAWSWVFLTLWIAWLVVMLYISRHEWGRARPVVSPDDVQTPRPKLEQHEHDADERDEH